MNFVKSLAKQFGPKGIRVNGVAPGSIWTPLQISGGQTQEKLKKSLVQRHLWADRDNRQNLRQFMFNLPPMTPAMLLVRFMVVRRQWPAVKYACPSNETENFLPKNCNMKKIIYWISTVLISAFMLFFAFAYLDHQCKMMAAFASLGYPSYFLNLLEIFKILGVIALLVPGFPNPERMGLCGFYFHFYRCFCFSPCYQSK